MLLKQLTADFKKIQNDRGWRRWVSRVTLRNLICLRIILSFLSNSAAIVSPSLTVYLLSKGFCLPDVIAAGFVIEAAGKADVEGDVTAVITPKHYDRFR